jgi:hypothetical protein
MAVEVPGGTSSARSHRVTTPRAGAVAGLLFAILFTISVTIMRLTLDDAATDTGEWLTRGTGWFEFAIGLMPFAGIFFLWFIAVARLHLGRLEDQFFSTVFLGSALIFLAMDFVAAGMAGGMLVSYAREPALFTGSTAYYLARDMTAQIFGIYAMRMAAVCVFSSATLWMRTRVMPRWLVVLSFLVGLVLLVVFTRAFWVILLFPAWVALVSGYILVHSFARRPTDLEPDAVPVASDSQD